MPEYQPLDYSGAFNNVPSPSATFLQGVQGGIGIQNLQLEQAQKQYQFQRMQQMQQSALQVAQNPTPEKIAQLSVAFPEIGEHMKRAYDMLQPQQQRAELQNMAMVHAASLNGQHEIAADLLNKRADALENSGAPALQVQQARAAAQWAALHPESFTAASGAMLASVMGPDKYGETFKSQTDAEKTQATTPAAVQEAQAKADTATAEAGIAPAKVAADVAKTQAETKNLAGRLSLDYDKLVSDTQTKNRELTLQYGTPAPETAALINKSAEGAAAGEQSAARLLDLANRMDQVANEGRDFGRVSDMREIGRKVFGTEDGVSALKQEYARIVNNQALGAIKESLGGRVTDVDMKTAMSSVPSPSASPDVVSSYLRGVAKIQQVDAARQQAQAEWLAQTGRNAHLGPAPHDLTIMGTKVPQGTTFADFSRQFIQQKAEQISAQSALAKANRRSYLRFAQPGADAPSTGGATGTY